MRRLPLITRRIAIVLAAGLFFHGRLVASSTVVAWGGGATGGPTAGTNLAPNLTNIIAVAAGDSFGLAVRSNGTVVAWGSGSGTNVPSGLTNIAGIAAGGSHCLALKNDGTLVAWGDTSYSLTNIPTAATNVVAIACGLYHDLALRADGKVVAWGANYSGQTSIPFGLDGVIAIYAGNAISFVLRTNGQVVVVGYPANISNAITNQPHVAMAGSAGTGVAVNPDGTVIPWGYITETNNVPPGLSNVIAVAAFAPFNQAGGVWALRRDGRLAGWGTTNQLGNTNIWMNLTNVIAIATGYGIHVALISDGLPDPVPPAVGVSYGKNQFRLIQPATLGRFYYLEYKDSLLDANWLMLPPAPGNGSNLTLIDSTATNSRRYYRVHVQ